MWQIGETKRKIENSGVQPGLMRNSHVETNRSESEREKKKKLVNIKHGLLSSYAVHEAMTAMRGCWGPDKERGQNEGEATLKWNLGLQQLKTFKYRLDINAVNDCYY